jgi:hypothetical protein
MSPEEFSTRLTRILNHIDPNLLTLDIMQTAIKSIQRRKNKK